MAKGHHSGVLSPFTRDLFRHLGHILWRPVTFDTNIQIKLRMSSAKQHNQP
jgi:hypothetical protein